MADIEEFLTDFAAVSSGDGGYQNYVKLYLQLHTGQVLEGTWRKATEQWRFKELMPAGVALVGTPLTAVMYPDDTIRLFFLDPERIIQEFEIVKGEASIGSFCTVKASLHEGAGLACAPQNWSNERFRVYHPGSEGRFKSYGNKDGAWDTPGTIAVEIDPQSPICSMNCFPWDWASPYIRTFYRNRELELKVLGWDDKVGGWHTDSTPFILSDSARFAATYVEAIGSGKDKVTTPPKIMLFVVEDGQLQVCGKNGEAHWSPPLAVGIERDGTNIAAVSPRSGDGINDVHVFTSDEEGSFVHRILKDGEWEDTIINPVDVLENPPPPDEDHPLLPVQMDMRMSAGSDFRVGVGHATEGEETPELGSISFMHSLQNAGLTLGAMEESNQLDRHNRLEVPKDEDHENIFVPTLKMASSDETLGRLTFFYRAALEHSVKVHQSSYIDSELPTFFPLKDMAKRYRWSNPRRDSYPPHLDQGPVNNTLDFLTNTGGIFRTDYLGPIVQLFLASMPWVLDFKDASGPYSVPWKTVGKDKESLANITAETHKLHKANKGMYTKNTIGDDPKWYTDEKFAQQHFTGTNPTTIRSVSKNWYRSFVKTAKAQGVNTFEKNTIGPYGKSSLYIQDYSYFREAMGRKPEDELSSTVAKDFVDRIPIVDKDGLHVSIHGQYFHARYGCAAVVLFELHEDGRLHPLAIVLDYKEGDIKLKGHNYEKQTDAAMTKSVVIFNKKLSPSTPHDEEHDWHWRYAKMCVQISDWHRHEISIHLVNTHLVEEAVIVGMMRTVEETHPVFRLMKPHWARTLPLNHAARLLLMPLIIKPIAGIRPSDMNKFTMDCYKNFHWEDLYIPNDLHKRGFPNTIKDLGVGHNKWRNYPYARNMVVMWEAIHTFVGKVLTEHYKNDDAVRKDTQIKNWVHEMRSDHGGQQAYFPDIMAPGRHALADLINVVTMCIHIASPQHTAVNYMQEYYQTFVPNKPPSWFQPIPATQDAFKAKVTEKFIIDSLPFVPTNLNPLAPQVGVGNVWLLAAHLPHLLSDEVHEPLSMEHYAAETVNMERAAKGSVKAAEEFRDKIKGLKAVFEKHSKDMTVKPTPDGYYVMDPKKMAVSILI
ncbi:hypothetical protein TWF281_011154 [Arthrobotrys megalospora]